MVVMVQRTSKNESKKAENLGNLSKNVSVKTVKFTGPVDRRHARTMMSDTEKIDGPNNSHAARPPSSSLSRD
jgi:hypothetical protein